mmetsp:Transcript_35855/g.69192  ORF Transcript_35855/g.69192 Transcript_35855/m.69192 type:complete len:101 (+) Transcript_35855:373-675(+)
MHCDIHRPSSRRVHGDKHEDQEDGHNNAPADEVLICVKPSLTEEKCGEPTKSGRDDVGKASSCHEVSFSRQVGMAFRSISVVQLGEGQDEAEELEEKACA